MSDFWLRACYRIPGALAMVGWMVATRCTWFPAELWLALLLASPLLYVAGDILGARAVQRRNVAAMPAQAARLPEDGSRQG